MPVQAAYTVAKIAVGRIGKNQDKIAGERAREGDEEGGVQEFRSAGVQESKEQFLRLSGILYNMILDCSLLPVMSVIWQKGTSIRSARLSGCGHVSREVSCLSMQMRRAAISVAANIAEGLGACRGGQPSPRATLLNSRTELLYSAPYLTIPQ